MPGSATPSTVDWARRARGAGDATGGAAAAAIGLPLDRPIIVPRREAGGDDGLGVATGAAGFGGAEDEPFASFGSAVVAGPKPIMVILDSGAAIGFAAEGTNGAGGAPVVMTAPHCAQKRAPGGAA